jgi:ZIP family zinc transporter
VTLAIAIAIHNIPEGLAVAAPVYSATKNRKKAVGWATVSGLAEPVGALFAAVMVSFFVPRELFGLLFGLVAGMMVFLSFDELLPAARRYASRSHHVVYGVAAGMAVVALSLILADLAP